MESERPQRRTLSGRLGEALLKFLTLFVILEPIWMLLPFAGFLYGSVLHIQTLSRHPETAWLTHFVFPILTLGPLGPVLGILGLLVFLVGAVQIYAAKIRKSGLVTGGLYRHVRHPQYTALTLFGVGILLTWGRALAFVAFFLMMFLYYWLAKLEERNCGRLFGEAYERYRERTAFAFTGDRLLRGALSRLPGRKLPAPLRALAGLVFTAALCFGLMKVIDAAKRTWRTVPCLTAEIAFETDGAADRSDLPEIEAGRAGALRFVSSGRVAVVRGPYRNAAAPGFAERVLLRIRGSNALNPFLGFLDAPGEDVALVFAIPFDRGGSGEGPEEPRRSTEGRGPAADPHGPDRVKLFVFRCTPTAGAGFREVFGDTGSRILRGACQAPVNLAAPSGADIVEGSVFRPGPGFPAEDRFEHLVRRVREEAASGSDAPDVATVPGRHSAVTLVMVRAPIYRTRRDPEFAREILARLEVSSRFHEHLRKSGAGGDVVALAFPTPGPDWYEQHHGKPVLHVFVAIARLRPGGEAPKDLFRREGRDLLGAFFAKMDFKVDVSADSVGGFSLLGARRNLEERFEFFLSGL